jgi:hypothetical protein
MLYNLTCFVIVNTIVISVVINIIFMNTIIVILYEECISYAETDYIISSNSNVDKFVVFVIIYS